MPHQKRGRNGILAFVVEPILVHAAGLGSGIFLGNQDNKDDIK